MIFMEFDVENVDKSILWKFNYSSDLHISKITQIVLACIKTANDCMVKIKMACYCQLFLFVFCYI